MTGRHGDTRMFILPSLTLGGAEKVSVELANSMAESARTMLVVAKGGPLEAEISGSVELRILGVERMRATTGALRRLISDECPSVVLSALQQANVATLLSTLGMRTRPKLIAAEHTDVSSLPTRDAIRARAMITATYWRADHVVAVSEGGRLALRAACPWLETKLCVVPNPVVTPRKLANSWAAVEHPWFQDRRRPLLVAVGRLTEAKDYATLFRSVKELQRSMKPRLLVLGEGELRSDLERLIQTLELGDSVELIGAVQNPMAWVRRADLYVMSSKREGLPSALIEALAVGAKVVSTDCRSGPREVLCGEMFGWLAPVGDSHALAGKVAEALDSPFPAGVTDRAMAYSSQESVKQYETLIRA